MYANYPWDLSWLPDSSGYYFKGNTTNGPGFDFYLVKEVGEDPVLITDDYAPASFPDPYPDVAWLVP
jgi:hypothetical protein